MYVPNNDYRLPTNYQNKDMEAIERDRLRIKEAMKNNPSLNFDRELHHLYVREQQLKEQTND